MIDLQNIHFKYPKGRSVLSDVSMELSPGNIYGLFGRNGEGKSTLMRLMAGLLFPQKGSCSVSSGEMTIRPVTSLQDIFIVPEDFELPAITVTMYQKINGVFYPKFDMNQFFQLIQEFGLLPNDVLTNLSLGQKKKVLIAFGIATNTTYLLMDEPTNGLDIPSKSQFRKIMATAVDKGACILIATHQVRDLHSLINHVIIIDQTKVVFDQPLDKVAERLWFGRPSQVAARDIIFTEGGLGGKAVLHLEGRDETEVDLEVLFSAVLEAPETISQALKSNNYAASL